MTRLTLDSRLWTGQSAHHGLSLVDEGAYDFWYRRRTWSQGVGQLKLKEPGEVHRDLRVHAPVSARSISLSSALWADTVDALELRREAHFSQMVLDGQSPSIAKLRVLLSELEEPAPDPLACESLLIEVVASVLAEQPQPEARPRELRGSREAAQRIRDRLHDLDSEPLHLAGLASQVGLNRFHLLRLFRAEFGLPPHAYLVHLRVARARALLERGGRPAEVATAVGFCDQSQLHRHFKRVVGLTPGQYRRAVAGSVGRRQ